MVATRFAVALHILLLLATAGPGQATSARMAQSVGTNPVVIRRISGRLARAGLIRVRRGPGGAELARPAEQITLADVWQAMRRGDAPLLPTHRPNPECPTGSQVPELLREPFAAAEAALAESLSHTTVADLVAKLQRPSA